MNFKEYYNNDQPQELMTEDLRTSLSNMLLGIFGKKVVVDVNSYPNQYVLPPSAYPKIMESLGNDVVTYWQQVNGAAPDKKGKSKYFSYQMKDVNGKGSKIKSEKYPIWSDVAQIVTGTSFYLQSKQNLGAFLKPFSTNGPFKKAFATARGGDIVIFDLLIHDDPENSKMWYPTIPGQEDKFENVKKSNNQFVLCCTNAGLKHIISMIGFPIPQYIKIESMKQMNYTKSIGLNFKTMDHLEKEIADLVGAAKKAANDGEGGKAEQSPEESGKTSQEQGKPSEDKTADNKTNKPAESDKIVVGKGSKFPIPKDVFDKLTTMLESKKIGFSAYINRLFNEAFDISKFAELADSNDNPLHIDGSNLPKAKLSTILKSSKFGFDSVKVEGSMATDNEVVYRLKKGNEEGVIAFIGGDKPYIAADENGKKWFRGDAEANIEGIYNSPEWKGNVSDTEATFEKKPEDTEATPEEKPAEGEKPAEKPAEGEKPADTEATPEEKPAEAKGTSKFEEMTGLKDKVDSEKFGNIVNRYGVKFDDYGTIPKDSIDNFIPPKSRVQMSEDVASLDKNPFGNISSAKYYRVINAKGVGYIFIGVSDDKLVKDLKNAKDLTEFVKSNPDNVGVVIISKKVDDSGDFKILASPAGQAMLQKINGEVFVPNQSYKYTRQGD